MPSRAITRQVADRISSRRASQSTIFGMSSSIPLRISDHAGRPVFLSDVRLTSVINVSPGRRRASERPGPSSSATAHACLTTGWPSAAQAISACARATSWRSPRPGSATPRCGPADICLVDADGTELRHAQRDAVLGDADAPGHLRGDRARRRWCTPTRPRSSRCRRRATSCRPSTTRSPGSAARSGSRRYVRFGSAGWPRRPSRRWPGAARPSCATTARSPAAATWPRPTTGPCSWSGWPAPTGWR